MLLLMKSYMSLATCVVSSIVETAFDEMLLLLKKLLLMLLMKSDMSLATGGVSSIVETASDEMLLLLANG